MHLKISITLLIDAHIIEKMGRGAPHVPPRKTLKNLVIKMQCKIKKGPPPLRFLKNAKEPSKNSTSYAILPKR